jgi:beta-lactamase class A
MKGRRRETFSWHIRPRGSVLSWLLNLALFAAIPLLICSQIASAETPKDGTAGSPVREPAAEATSSANASTKLPDEIAATIDALVSKEPGVYGVVLMRPDGSVLYSRNGNMPFVSASLYKLILLADICREIDDGELEPDTQLYIDPEYFAERDGWDAYFDPSYAETYTTVQEAMYAAGAFSSNVAAKALLTETSTEDLNATATDLGLTGTFLFTDPEKTPAWPPIADNDTSSTDANNARQLVLSYATDGKVNLTTPMDMAHYFSLLMNGEVYNERVSAMITAILHEQMIDDRFPALLPAGTEMVHKTGNLDHVVHDVGVIYAPAGPVILAALVEAPSNDERATQIVQRLALIAYGILDVPPVTAPIYAVEAPEEIDGTAGSLPDGAPDDGTDVAVPPEATSALNSQDD